MGAGGSAAVDVAIPEAVRAFGWVGSALPELVLTGSRLVPVVEFDLAAHRVRVRAGDGPQMDADTLAIWEWTQSAGHAPPPALRLTGVLIRARRGWRRALGQARSWRGFGPAGVVVPPGAYADETCRLEFAVHGVGLAPSGPLSDEDRARAVEPVVFPAPGRTAPRGTADRWIEETLYRHALDHGSYPVRNQRQP